MGCTHSRKERAGAWAPASVSAAVFACLGICAAVTIFAVQGPCIAAAKRAVLMAVLACAAREDLHSRTIPDGLVCAGLGARAAFLAAEGVAAGVRGAAFPGTVFAAASAGLAGAFALSAPVLALSMATEAVTKRPAMGGGDVKLLFMAGSFLPCDIGLAGLLLSCAAGIVLAAAGRSRLIPFAAAAFPGFWVASLL